MKKIRVIGFLIVLMLVNSCTKQAGTTSSNRGSQSKNAARRIEVLFLGS